jgi:predicted component of type VI protein secretion system
MKTWPGFLLSVTVLALILSACVVYEPYYYPASQSDRVWESALRAAQDVGITISTADKVNGTILGRKEPSEVTISVLTLTDGRIKVQMNVRGPEGADPYLSDRFLQTYQRYMGR